MRTGTDCTVITYGGGVAKALAASEKLDEEGTSSEVIDLRTLSPLDVGTCVTSVKKTGRAIVLDEAPKMAGPGAEIAATVQELAFEYLDAPMGVSVPYKPLSRKARPSWTRCSRPPTTSWPLSVTPSPLSKTGPGRFFRGVETQCPVVG